MTQDRREQGAKSEQEALEALFRAVESQESLDGALEALRLASPEGAGRLVDVLAEKGVPITFNSERRNSAAVKSLYRLLHRESEAAERVEIRKGASLLEVIHELGHAVPLREHMPQFQEVEVQRPDLSKSDGEVVQALKRLAFKDEAVAVASEIEAGRDLERIGVETTRSGLGEKVIAIYDEEGVEGLANRFGELFPSYEEYYTSLARRSLPALRSPAGQAQMINWGDKLGGIGVDAEVMKGGAEVSVDPDKMLDNAKGLLAGLTREKVESGARQAADMVKEALEQNAAKRRVMEKISTPDKLAELPKFDLPPKPESSDRRIEALQKDPQAALHRVRAGGRMALMLQRAAERLGEKKAYAWVPDVALRRAEQATGDRSARIYETLGEVLAEDQEKGEEHYQQARDMALSLIKSGYESEGRELLNYYIDNYAVGRDMNRVSSLTLELLDKGQEEAAFRMFHEVSSRLGRIDAAYLQDLKKEPSNYGEFTPRGQAQWDAFFAERQGSHVGSEEAHAFMRTLYKEGDYQVRDIWKDVMRQQHEFKNSREESYCRFMAELVPAAQGFAEAAARLASTQPQIAREYETLARDIYDRALVAGQRSFEGRMKDYHSDYPKARYDPNKGWLDFARQIMGRHEASEEFNFVSGVSPHEAHRAIGSMLRKPETFSAGLEALYQLTPEVGRLDMFSLAAKHLPENISPQERGQFFSAWEREMQGTLQFLQGNQYVEYPLGGSVVERRSLEKDSDAARPASLEETNLFMSQRLEMARTLLRLGDDGERARALQMIRGLSGSAHDVYNPHMSVMPALETFERKTQARQGLSLFNPAQLKVHALLEAAQLAPEQAAQLRQEALQLVGQIEIDPEKDPPSLVECKAWRLVEMFDALVEGGELEPAQNIYERLGGILQNLRRHYEHEAEVLKMPRRGLMRIFSDNDQLLSKRFVNEMALKQVDFWEQHHASSLRASLASVAARSGQEQSAIDTLEEVRANVDSDVRGRRDRFDVRSVIQGAAAAAELPQLEEQAAAMFALATEKIGLQRGDYNLFQASLDYFIDSLKESGLAPERKDEILKAFVLEIAPSELSDWDQMSGMIPALTKLSRDIGRDGNYPNTEREILRIFADAAEQIEFAAEDRKMWFKMEALAAIANELQETHPEIFHSANFQEMAALSGEMEYLQELNALLPDQAREHFAGDVLGEDGLFDMVKIKAGLHSLETTLSQAHSELDRILVSPEMAADRLEHIMKTCEELGRQDLVAALAQASNRRLSYQEIATLPSSKRLIELLGGALSDPEAELTPHQSRLAQALFHAEGRAEAAGKYEMYLEFIGNEKAPTEIQRIAFEDLLKSGRAGAFVIGYFEDNMIDASDEDQRHFYRTAKELLQIGGDTLSSKYDDVTSWILEDPSRSGEMLQKFREMYSRETMPNNAKIGDRYVYLRKNDEAEFRSQWEDIRQNLPETWVPDMLDEDQLLLAYHKHIHFFMTFQGFQKAMEFIYVNEEFRYGSGRQEIEVRSGPESEYVASREMEIVLQVFGPRKLDAVSKERLSAAVNGARRGYERRRGEIEARNVPMPEVFERQPEVVRFLLREYFGQLPYGERQALITEFESESGHLTGPEAIRRTFELTGTEKIGQFLSVRRDLLPVEYCEELKKFQENVEGAPFEEIRNTIETELGRPIGEVFQEVDPVPLNIGTVGQVHEGRLLNGERVVIKVIPSSKRRTVSRMLDRMQKVCLRLDKNKDRFPGAYDPMGMYDEFSASMGEEVDFRNEFNNAESLRGTMGAGVSTPKYYKEFVNRSVLVQSFAEGERITDASSLEQRKNAIAGIGEMLMDQILERGEFHDDLHPGNIRFNAETGEKVVLDYGRIGKLSEQEREGLIPLLMAVREKSADKVLRTLESISAKSDRFDRAGLRAAFDRIMSSGSEDAPVLMSDLFSACAEHGMTAPPSYLRVLKAVMTFEGTAKEADPSFDLGSFLKMIIVKKKLKGMGSLLGKFVK